MDTRCNSFSAIFINFMTSCWLSCKLVPSKKESSIFFREDYSCNILFSTAILSLPLIQEGQLSVSGVNMCTILVNRLQPAQ